MKDSILFPTRYFTVIRIRNDVRFCVLPFGLCLSTFNCYDAFQFSYSRIF